MRRGISCPHECTRQHLSQAARRSVAANACRKGRYPPVQPQQRTKVFETLFENYEGPAFSLRLWDGWQWFSPQCGEPACTIVFSSEGALQSMVLSPGEVALAEAFLSKEIDVEGDIFSVFDVAEHIFQCPRGQRQRVMDVIGAAFAGIGYSLRHGRTHSVERDHEAITYHYDQPPEFYRPWLGTTMAYSCGYFDTPSDDVDTAQVNKLELIWRNAATQRCSTTAKLRSSLGNLTKSPASACLNTSASKICRSISKLRAS